MDLAPRQVVIDRHELEELERARRGLRILLAVWCAGFLTGLAFAWLT